MHDIMDSPLLIFVITFCAQILSAWVGVFLLGRRSASDDELGDNFSVIQAAALTMLALIIGFSFSMAVNRYDQRKTYEEAEANAIGTEIARADLLPSTDAEKVRVLLKSYLDLRIAFYITQDAVQIKQINAQTQQAQARLWSAIQAPAAAQPTPVIALVVSGMNDVLNSQSYTQAAWWNRIPVPAWALMIAFAICANVMVGFGTKNNKREFALLLVLPLVTATAFLLIADIDSPRGGFIHVSPQNLIDLSTSSQARS